MSRFRQGLFYFFTLTLLFFAFDLKAQHSDMVDSTQKQVFADSGRSYFIPDVQRKRDMGWTKGGNKLLTWQLGFVPIIDYDLNMQNEQSEKQVGKQESRLDIRSARFSVRGNLNFAKNPWSYMVSLEYKGLDRTQDDDPFGFTDIKLIIPAGKNGNFTLGKIKETFIYEMVGDAANLPHQERLLSPFFRSRNAGVVYKHYFMKDRLSAAAGWFNDFIQGQGNNTFTARVTGLNKWEEKGKQFVHTGFGFRYVQAKEGTIRLRGKNQSNVGSNYVDTKDFAADYQMNFSFEQLWSLENYSMLFEYAQNWTKTPTGTEQFKGYYVTGSYIISGEQRPYDMKAGYARRVKPDGKAGAFEVVTRFGRVNLDSRNISGGINTIYSFGLNWWATQYWKAGMFYTISNLDKNDFIGVTNSFQWRIQWVF
jgi:phosphate-selective porin